MPDVGGSPTVRHGAPGPASEVDPRIGTIVADRYRVLERLGHGGMGVVYRVHDRALEVDVAMKLLPAAIDPRDLEHVQREVRLARRVTHPNVCRLHDVAIDPAGCYITMELVLGESLADWLDRDGRLAPPEATRVLGDVAAGLAAAHAAGVIHRDLKPANILIAQDGRAVVADFGIATGHAGDAAGDIAGTTGYMAPEHAAGEPIDARADVYAFGALACRLLAGRIPGSAADAPSSRGKGADADAPPTDPDAVRRLLAGHPAPLVDLIAKTLATAPADRPADGAALVTALAAAAAGPARHRRRAAVLALGAIAIAAGAVALGVAAPWRAATPSPVSLAPALVTVAGDDLAAGQAWAPPALAAAVRDELAWAWGVELAPARAGGRRARAIAVILARSSAGWRAANGATAIEGATLGEVAERLVRAVVLRDLPIERRRPTAADLAVAGAADAEAWRLWRRARRAAMLQHWDRTRDLCGAALARDPGFALAALELAIAYDGGDAAQAPALAHAYALFERRRPGGPWPHAFALIAASDEATRSRELEAARAVAADDLDRRYIDVRWAVGQLVTGRDDRAVPMLELIRERWPDEGSAWKALARHYVTADAPGALALALAASAQAIALLPDDVGIRADRALALVRAGDVVAARAEAALAVQLDPGQRAAARSSLFAFHMSLGDVAEATSEALRMLAGPPRQQAEGMVALAFADLWLGRFDRGLTGLDAAAATYARLGFSVAAARTRLQAARQALALGRVETARPWLAEVAAGGTHYAAVASVLLALAERGPAAGRAALAVLSADAPGYARLDVELAAAAGDDAAVLAAQPQVTVPVDAMAVMTPVATALERVGRRADAIEVMRALVSHVEAWREPVVSGAGWKRLGDLARAAGDVEAARAAYGEYLRRREGALPSPELRAIKAYLRR